jgi:hypothetical protein
MKSSRIASLMLAAGLVASSGPAFALTADEVKSIAIDAYVYGYSLITTEVTRVQMTHTTQASPEHQKAPMGQFLNVPRYPPANYRGISAPNADTLYSIAWIDVSEPQVFSQPAMPDGRFYMFPMYNLWMVDFASKGSRTAGQAAANYLLTRSDWKGEVPKGMVHVPVETRYMVILGRTYANGTEADYKAVNGLQAQLKITPLSAWGTDYKPKAAPLDPNPPFSMTDKPQKVILDMGTKGYFDMMARLMCKDAPPVAADKSMVEKMAQIGLKPCETFDMSKFDAQTQAALKDLPQEAMKKIENNQKSLGQIVNGWQITKGLGQFGTDYMKRAVVAAFGWPSNVQEDAVYPYTMVDSSGAALNGAHKYTLTFAKGQEPPVKGFWSITMYQIDQGWWFVPNALNKFTVSPRNDLKKNADGTVTLYFQTESPGKDKEANWLPAPKGDFNLMLRMYWPQETSPSILNGSWTPPKVVKVN